MALRAGRQSRAAAVLVFEDDVCLHPNFRQLAEALPLPEDWGIFLFGAQHIRPPVPAGPGVVRLTSAYSLHAYAVRQCWLPTVLAAMGDKTVRNGRARQCDVALAELADTIPIYAAWPNLAWQACSYSDIQRHLRRPYLEDGRQAWAQEAVTGTDESMLHLMCTEQASGLDYRLCPVCGWTGERFGPFGIPVRLEARCPGCGSLERHRLLWRWLKANLWPLAEGQHILHFAPERCLSNHFRRLNGVAYVTADFSGKDVTHREDIQSLSFADAAFYLVICSHVLEHVPDDRQGMSELFRVTKPGGVCLVMVPVRSGRQTYENRSVISAQDRLRHFGQWDHVRWYGDDIAARLEGAGFHVEPSVLPETATLEAVRCGLTSETIFVCRKARDAMGSE